MPENISGHPGMPDRGDAESSFKDTLARIEEQLAGLAEAVAALSKRISDAEAEAEDILRRAIVPARPPRRPPPRRGGMPTWLRVVKAFAIAVAGAGLILAMYAPQRVSRQDCYVQAGGHGAAGHCWRPVAHDSDGDHDHGR